VDLDDLRHLQRIVAGVVVQHDLQAVAAVVVIGVDVAVIPMFEQLVQVADTEAADESEPLLLG
jgi:hypothetical protein